MTNLAASLYLGVLVLSFVAVDCASMEDGKPVRIGRKLLGRAGEDYPTFPVVPSTAFKCIQNKPGYYADVEALCQVFHLCQIDGRHDSFLCPNGTLFNQNYFVCDWWYNVDCSAAPSRYILNELLFQHPQLSAREQANNKLVNRDPTSQSHDAPSHILAAKSENVASSIQQQQTVTVTAAREQQQQKQQLSATTTTSTADKYGAKIPGVNRMGGLDAAELIENNLADNGNIALVAPVTESEMLLEITEASPTTIQPFNEEEFTSDLKLKLNLEKQQIFLVPVTTNAPEEFQENKTFVNKLVASSNEESYNSTGGKLADSSSDSGAESIENTLTANEQLLDEELSTVQPNLADAQTSAAVVTLNSVSEKDLDDYRTSTLTSPTTDPAAHFLEIPDMSPEESTEFSSSTNKAISSQGVVVDSIQSNFVAGLETTTFPAISLHSADNVLKDELPHLTPSPDLFSSPIIESLEFNILTDSSNSFSSATSEVNINSTNNNVQISTSAFAETSIIPSNNINVDSANNSQLTVITPTTSPYKEIKTSTSTTTRKPIKNNDSPVISLITYSDGKRTLYEKLKPALLGDARSVVPAIYGRKIHPRNGNKTVKYF